MSTRGTVWMSMSKDQIGFGCRRFTNAVVVVDVVDDVVVKETNAMLEMTKLKLFERNLHLDFWQ